MKWVTSAMWTPTYSKQMTYCGLRWNIDTKNLLLLHYSVCVPQGFHCPALDSAGHHLCLYILEDPHCTLSDAAGPPSSPCPVPHTSTLIYTQTYTYVLSNYRVIDPLINDQNTAQFILTKADFTSGVMAHGVLGRKLSTAWENAWWGTSCSSSSTSCSVSLSPAHPRLRTKWP